MKRIFALGTATLFALVGTACGGGDTGGEAGGGIGGGEMETGGQMETGAGQTGGDLTRPDWYQIDEANRTVTLNIVAGQTAANNSWNFNGHANGEATIVVPQGYTVTVNFSNQDQTQMTHSFGIDERAGRQLPPMFAADVSPVFEGAITSNATNQMEATANGESETITFTVDRAGEFTAVCYVPGHAVAGMWLGFTVSAEGEGGVRMAM